MTAYGSASGSLFASPLSVNSVASAVSSIAAIRWVTRTPSADSTLTTSPTARSSAGTDRATPSEPLGMSGDIEPDVKIRGTMPSTVTRPVSKGSAPSTRPCSMRLGFRKFA